MVGVTLRERERPVQLLDEHDAGEAVRQSHFGQRPTLGGARSNRRRMSIGTTDEQRQIG